MKLMCNSPLSFTVFWSTLTQTTKDMQQFPTSRGSQRFDHHFPEAFGGLSHPKQAEVWSPAPFNPGGPDQSVPF